jgi:hypothetical protein
VGQKPYVRLATPRTVDRPELSPDLAEFYARHEGVGLEADWKERPVRLCKFAEVTRVGWEGLNQVGDVPEGWERFAALRVGMGMYFEEIVYVLDAPSCPPGSVLAVGTNLVGCEGGDGPFKLDGSLVLAPTFPAWLDHLKRWGWEEPVIAGMGGRPKAEYQELCRYYLALNPSLNCDAPEKRS